MQKAIGEAGEDRSAPLPAELAVDVERELYDPLAASDSYSDVEERKRSALYAPSADSEAVAEALSSDEDSPNEDFDASEEGAQEERDASGVVVIRSTVVFTEPQPLVRSGFSSETIVASFWVRES